MRIPKYVTALIGNAPIVRINRLAAGCAAEVVEARVQESGASVKDRIAVAMIDAAQRAGKITPGPEGIASS